MFVAGCDEEAAAPGRTPTARLASKFSCERAEARRSEVMDGWNNGFPIKAAS